MKKSFNKVVAFAILAACSTCTAVANELKWDMIGAGYQAVDIDDEPIKFDGFSVNGSKVIYDNVFVAGSYESTSSDDFIETIDLDQVDVGVGYFYPVSQSIHVYGKIAYLDQTVESATDKISEDATGLEAGARFKASDIVEFETSVERIKATDYYDTRVEAAIKLEVATSLELVARYSVLDDAKTSYLGVSYYF